MWIAHNWYVEIDKKLSKIEIANSKQKNLKGVSSIKLTIKLLLQALQLLLIFDFQFEENVKKWSKRENVEEIHTKIIEHDTFLSCKMLTKSECVRKGKKTISKGAKNHQIITLITVCTYSHQLK